MALRQYYVAQGTKDHKLVNTSTIDKHDSLTFKQLKEIIDKEFPKVRDDDELIISANDRGAGISIFCLYYHKK